MTTADDVACLSKSHRRALEDACVGRDPTTVRQIRRDVCGFVAWCAAVAVDPFRPSGSDLDLYQATLLPTPAKSARWKLRFALRAFANAGDALADEHGLGTGHVSPEVLLFDAGVAHVVSTFLRDCKSPRDRSVYESGLNKLARWAKDFEVDLMALDPADLEDFRTWIRTVGGKEGEILVIARKFIRLTEDVDVRRSADLARRPVLPVSSAIGVPIEAAD